MITGVMGQSGITSLAKEIEYAKRVDLFPPCTSRLMTDEEKRRYENMNGSADKTMMNRRGPKPKQIRYCPGCDERLQVKESQLTDNVMVTCHSCGGGYDAAMLGRTPRGGDATVHKPESLEGRAPATVNPEFEKAVQKMVDPDDEPIPHEVVKKPEPDECWQAAAEAGWKQAETKEVYAPEGITEALADIIFKFNKEHQRGFDEGYEAGKAAAKVAMQNALEAC